MTCLLGSISVVGPSKVAIDRISRVGLLKRPISPFSATFTSGGILIVRTTLSLSWSNHYKVHRRKFLAVAMAELVPTDQITKIDSHLHVWASPEEAKKFPYFPGQEPHLLGSGDHLLEQMKIAHVSGALIIQPINHKFDHSYVSSIISKYPGKFIGCCLANPANESAGVAELSRLVTEEGYRAVRFNPYLWPNGEKMTNHTGKQLFSMAGKLGVPVGFMCFKGLLLHIDEIEELCREFPQTKVIMDHFGFCKPPKSEAETTAWNRLLQLARFPQVYVKASAFFRVSSESFPYRDTWSLVRQLVNEFGANRVMWGSDFPFVVAECGYEGAWQILEGAKFSQDELKLIMGGTAKLLFEDAWHDRRD